MRLAYLMSRYPGTSQVFVQREVLGLRERGVDILTISVRRSPEVLSDTDRAEAQTTRFLLPSSAGALVRANLRALRHPVAWLGALASAFRDAPQGRRAMQLLYWGEAVLLWDLLRREGIGHLHVHFAANASDIALIATRLGRRAGEGPRSFSLHLHGPTDFFDVQRNRIGLKAREASGVICISDYARSQVLAWIPLEAWDRVHVARYGAPLPAVARSAGSGGAVRVLNVARLAGVKGHAVLLRALAQANAQDAKLELDVAGDGPLASDLRALADELGIAASVRWHGALAHDAVARLYAEADVFCLPSFAEGLPVVVLEAMAAGLPVVATAITGVPEAVDHEREGLLVRPGRVDELAAALLRLARDADLRGRMGAAGRRRVECELSDAASSDEIKLALERVVP